ncbi:MAG: GAK system CofD-like protein [Desulfobacteraceae bacterium]|jgi:CofD-related protein of GAK system
MLIRISRQIEIPDPVRIERYRRLPEYGPKILFFSGGSALRGASRELMKYTHNSIHIISAFDSGGSSAILRRYLKMPAIGDIRNRLMALADRSILGNPEIFNLFSYRFPDDAHNGDLGSELDRMIRGKHRLVAAISDPMRKIIRNHLFQFRENVPEDFDLRKASIGNLILAGGYLGNQRHLDPVIYIFSRLVQVKGIVRPVISKDLHLAAELEDSTVVVGQHLLTGKEKGPLNKRIVELFLTENIRQPEPVHVKLRKKVTDLIGSAELICFPMGSFFTSIIANLLPDGVGTSIGLNSCPKIFIPNTGNDPELYGLSVADQVEILIRYLKKDNEENIASGDLLNFVVIDRKNGDYGEIDCDRIRKAGIEVIDCPLISEESAPYIDEKLLVPILLSFI